jgi:drug/metabolite transporter (DMT)-like permease
VTPLAIMLAVAAAVTFGVAAVNQHRAVQTLVAPRRRQMAIHQIGTLVTDGAWLRGFGLMVLGTAFHVTALTLAPISVTQPINVLAVPTTIIVVAMITRRRPARSVILAAGAVVLGVAGIVSSLTDASAGDLPTPVLLAAVAVAVAAVTLTCHLGARHLVRSDTRLPRWLAPVLLSIAGAIDFGVTSSTFRLLAQDLRHTQPLPLSVTVALVCFVPIGLAVGAWSIQQAYASGAAPAVTATSAITDPVVALVIGMVVLGETPHMTVDRLLVLTVAALLAAAGVIWLAQVDDDAEAHAEDTRHQWFPDSPRSHSRQITKDPHAHPARR